MSEFYRSYAEISRGVRKRAAATLLSMSMLAACASQDRTATPSIKPTEPATPTPTALVRPSPTEQLLPTVTSERPTQTPNASEGQDFFTGVSTMNQSKDKLRNPLTPEQKKVIVQRAKELGVDYVGIETPYDGPNGTDAVKESREWVNAVHEQGLGVIHRHMFISFEGIYDQKRDRNQDYVSRMQQWMRDNNDLIGPKDIWVPTPEPENAGVIGANCNDTPTTPCMFKSVDEFNTWIQQAVIRSRDTLQEIGKPEVQVLCCGFNGYTVWGDNNPDRQKLPPFKRSFLTEKTVQVLGGTIAVDHYPQKNASGKRATYADAVNGFKEVWPNANLVFTEFGRTDTDAEPIEDTVKAFTDPAVKGVMWFQMGPSGQETLLNPDFSPSRNFPKLKDGIVFLNDQKKRKNK